MRKIYIILLAIFLTFLVSCDAHYVEHPIMEERTIEETQKLIRKLQNSTVSLVGYIMEFEVSLGSGMIFKKEPTNNSNEYYYYVVTNQHVVEDMSHVDVVTFYGRVELGDIYAFGDGVNSEDIAIVRFISDFDYPVIPIIPYEDSSKQIQVTVGQTVFGIGTPLDTVYHNIVTDMGIIYEVSGQMITHSSNINPGNSGGPLFSYDGTFIGINTQRLEIVNGHKIDSIGDAIHANQVARMIRTRLNAIKPKLGIHILDSEAFLSTNYVNSFGEQAIGFDPNKKIPAITGVVIMDVNSTRPSYGLLERYDLIVSINGVRIYKGEDLIKAVGEIKVGNTYSFEVYRYNDSIKNFELLEIKVMIS
ncbi:MAG TPA: serine protease [Acholeplasma sp.]|nr:serine protease [Acholeplasma sp.]